MYATEEWQCLDSNGCLCHRRQLITFLNGKGLLRANRLVCNNTKLSFLFVTLCAEVCSLKWTLPWHHIRHAPLDGCWQKGGREQKWGSDMGQWGESNPEVAEKVKIIMGTVCLVTYNFNILCPAQGNNWAIQWHRLVLPLRPCVARFFTL